MYNAVAVSSLHLSAKQTIGPRYQNATMMKVKWLKAVHLYSSSTRTALVHSSHSKGKKLSLHRTSTAATDAWLWHSTLYYITTTSKMSTTCQSPLQLHSQNTRTGHSPPVWLQAPRLHGGRQVCVSVCVCLWLINKYSLGPRSYCQCTIYRPAIIPMQSRV